MLAIQLAGIPLARTQGELTNLQREFLVAAMNERERRAAEAQRSRRRR